MKRVILFCLLLLCGIHPAQADEWLVPEAVQLGVHIDALASDENYLNALTGSERISQLCLEWGSQNHNQPFLILHAPVESLCEYDAAVLGLPDFSGFSPEAQKEWIRKFPLSLPGYFNGFLGAETLAASSVCSVSTAFAHEGNGGGLLLLLYSDAVPIMGGWFAANGAVTLSVSFVPDAALQLCDSAEDAERWLHEKGFFFECFELPLK